MQSVEHFERFFVFSAAGLGLLLVGVLNLALCRGGRRVWLRVAATLVVCGVVVGVLAALTRPELALRAAAWLGGVVLVATGIGSGWLARQFAAFVNFFRKPVPRWALVGLVGLTVIIGSGIAFDRDDEAVMDEGMRDLELATGRPPSRSAEGTQATTDRGTQVVLKEPIEPRPEADLAEPEAKTLRGFPFADQLIRKGGPTDHSNCHGWVFTGGKFLLSPEDVELIVKENGYRESHDPQPGDLVIYRQGGAISHSAIVRYVTEGQPVLVEGKWGMMGVFLHPADKSCYGTEFTFYHSHRHGHLLVGLGGASPRSAPSVPITAE